MNFLEVRIVFWDILMILVLNNSKITTARMKERRSYSENLPDGIECVFAQKDVLVEKWERQMQADDTLAVTGTVFRWHKDLMKEE